MLLLARTRKGALRLVFIKRADQLVTPRAIDAGARGRHELGRYTSASEYCSLCSGWPAGRPGLPTTGDIVVVVKSSTRLAQSLFTTFDRGVTHLLDA